jgi:uncharacterized protein (DUF302 family)
MISIPIIKQIIDINFNKMGTSFQTKRITTKLHSTYDRFIENLESTLPKLNPEDFKDLTNDPEKTKTHLESIAGKENLAILSSRPHGSLLKLIGIDSKATTYEVGNPLLVLRMTSNDLRVALYTPIRVLVYEDSNQQAFAEYDLPSSTLAQFQNDQVNRTTDLLDILLEKLLREVDGAH